MTPARKQRLLFILALVTGASVALMLSLFALGQNINLFFTPSEVMKGLAPKNHSFRIGGLVEIASVHYSPNNTQVEFALTDNHQHILVTYNGMLPTLFREGQGVVAEGHLTGKNEFVATNVLAKHDENYMPPEVAKSLYDPRTR